MIRPAARSTQQRPAGGYVGRFAPSPTGPLHFGSILAAVGSWLDARAAGGRWLLRLDDLDTPRNAPGAGVRICDELVRLGLEWDGEVLRQSADPSRYHAVLAQLVGSGAAFPCACSRRDLVDGIYPGTCRAGLAPGAHGRSIRLRVWDACVALDDRVQGHFAQNLQNAIGDFVLLRADGIVAYHLATVLDDAAAGVTHVIRGADLLASTPRQIALQQVLGLATPHYAHLPIAINPAGQKLSKQTHAAATGQHPPAHLWCTALRILGCRDADTMRACGLKEIRDWALTHWSLARVPAPPVRVSPQLLDGTASPRQTGDTSTGDPV